MSRQPFEIDTAEALGITDTELHELLTQVYVDAGFTAPAEAVSLFEPSAVRARGQIIAARKSGRSTLAGIIILVPYDSPARRLATNGEAELHLLGVKPEFRKMGLGRMLIEAAIEQARSAGFTRLILWTQIPMQPAQRLYEATGFRHIDTFERNGRHFKLYERPLNQ